jgi:ATP-dependent Clp protease ATP-binding subunit ClpA
MVGRLSLDARADVFEAAKEEAQMRGQNRVGSDHLLLALLREPEGVASRVLGMDVDQGRHALEQLDARALAAVGVQASEVPPAASSAPGPDPLHRRSEVRSRAFGPSRAEAGLEGDHSDTLDRRIGGGRRT